MPAGDATTGPAVGELVTGQSKDIFLRYEVLDQPTSDGDVYTATAVAAAGPVGAEIPDPLPGNNIITERTTKFHVSSILAKLDAHNRTEAVKIAAQRGLVKLAG